MPIIKKKSLIVSLISILVICLVLVVTLAGYLLYLELKDDELNSAYLSDLSSVNAKVYSKQIEIARLGVSIDDTGPLSGKAVLEGIVRNDGYRDITDLCLKVRFLDADGAVLYSVTFRPQEPSLGPYGVLSQVSASHPDDRSISAIKPESSMPFKKILIGCPAEILAAISENAPPSGGKQRWAGRLDYEILSVKF